MDDLKRREENLNCVTHALGALLSAVGLIILLMAATSRGDAWRIAAFTVFGTSMVLLYLASTCYHGFRTPRLKRAFRIIDHCCIYLLIAGTYTPFTLLNMRGAWGWTLFTIVWTLAILGILVKAFHVDRFPVLSVLVYLGMGWICVIAIKPTLTLIHPAGLWLLAAGGLAYTVGVIFYSLDRPYYHAVWHLFVMGGTACHFVAVLYYAA